MKTNKPTFFKKGDMVPPYVERFHDAPELQERITFGVDVEVKQGPNTKGYTVRLASPLNKGDAIIMVDTRNVEEKVEKTFLEGNEKGTFFDFSLFYKNPGPIIKLTPKEIYYA